jgi:hypothetical protein
MIKKKKDDMGGNAKPMGVMTAEQAKGAKASYEATTGKKYVPKTPTSAKAAPSSFKSKAEKDAWFAKNAPDRASKGKKK